MSTCEKWLPCTFALFRLKDWKSSRSRGKVLWEWDHRGWQESKSDSRIELGVLISSGGMEGLTFILGFMNHSKVSSIGYESWKVEEDQGDGLGIWFLNLQTSTLSQGGTQIGTGKEGGRGKKRIVGSSYEISDVLLFSKFGEIGTSMALDSNLSKDIWTKCSKFYLKKSQSIYSSGNP